VPRLTRLPHLLEFDPDDPRGKALSSSAACLFLESSTTMARGIQSASDTQACFQSTHWSLIVAARETEGSAAASALEKLCCAYWPPLYAFIRRHGSSPEEAQDLTQQFFVRLLEEKAFANVSPEKGRFRSFLLAALKHFLINEWHRQQCQKRGGGQSKISIDADSAEARYKAELVEAVTPESVFERQWAFTVLDQTMERLRAEYTKSGKERLFDLLRETLTGHARTTPRAELAARCGMSVAALDVAVHRLRRRYGELLREEIAQTLNDPRDVEEEIRHLKRVLARP